MKTKSALSYFGSDSEVAAELAALLDDCSHVTIPFVGGASILPHLKARAIVANDLHAAAITFYRFASGRYGESQRLALVRKCESTLSHPEEIELAKTYLDKLAMQLSVDYAWAFWALCWIGRKGKGGTKHQGGMPSVRRTANGGTNASRITAAAADLEAWAKQFKRCEWTQEDFCACLDKVADVPGCGIYCDPPWVGAGRNYLHTFTDVDHSVLAFCLDRFEQATVVLRYGDAPLIRDLYPADRWTWTQASSRTQANKVREEVWITRNAKGVL